jgi:uncharacterized protein (TIGR00251 family)
MQSMYIKVKITPGAKKELITVVSATSYTISVKEPAEQNRANRRLVELIAEHYGISAKQVKLISGHHSPSKILSVPDDLV